MAKFKVGDRVRVVGPSNIGFGSHGANVLGTVLQIVQVDYADEDATYAAALPDKLYLPVWFPKGSLELVKESKKDESASKTETQPMTVNISIGAELTHITIGGKRFRLVAED